MLKPLNDRVLVKPLKNEEKTASGIILPDTVEKERSEKGEVIATGPGRMLETGQRAPMSVAVGNKVLFKKYSPEEIKVDGEEYLVLDERDILAIIE
ncbi:co-chaperone GroES [Candidatus Parcubacteria bacterium]|nr:co-chaperone GroES [Candidatus Parcubacteria bacterium]